MINFGTIISFFTLSFSYEKFTSILLQCISLVWLSFRHTKHKRLYRHIMQRNLQNCEEWTEAMNKNIKIQNRECTSPFFKKAENPHKCPAFPSKEVVCMEGESWKSQSPSPTLLKTPSPFPDWVTDRITADTKNCLRWLERGAQQTMACII